MFKHFKPTNLITDPDGAAVLQPVVVLPVRRPLALPPPQEDEETGKLKLKLQEIKEL